MNIDPSGDTGDEWGQTRGVGAVIAVIAVIADIEKTSPLMTRMTLIVTDELR